MINRQDECILYGYGVDNFSDISTESYASPHLLEDLADYENLYTCRGYESAGMYSLPTFYFTHIQHMTHAQHFVGLIVESAAIYTWVPSPCSHPGPWGLITYTYVFMPHRSQILDHLLLHHPPNKLAAAVLRCRAHPVYRGHHECADSHACRPWGDN
jgi:hypothetical protein